MQGKLLASVPQDERDGTRLLPVAQDRINRTLLLEASITGWENFTDEVEGKEVAVPYSKEACKKFLFDPEMLAFYEAALWAATQAGRRAKDQKATIEGNLSSASVGT